MNDESIKSKTGVQGQGGQGQGAGPDAVGGERPDPQQGLGQNQQSYGQSTEQDTSGGQGPQIAKQAAAGQSGNLGPGVSQSLGQPRSATTGGPDLSQGLSDGNKTGGL